MAAVNVKQPEGTLCDQRCESTQLNKDYSALIEDEIYDHLRRCFLATGKGRRPKLPQPFGESSSHLCSNKLLIQLQHLRNEGNRTIKDMENWFSELFPAAGLPLKCIRGLVQKAERNMLERSDKDAQAMTTFLEETFDVNFICEELAEVGIDWTNIFEPSQFTARDGFKLRNKVVVALGTFCSKQQQKPSLLVDWINVLTVSQNKDAGVCCDYPEIKSVLTKYKTLSRDAKRHPDKLQSFLEREFGVQNICSSGSEKPVRVEKTLVQINQSTISNNENKKLQKRLDAEFEEKTKFQKRMEHLEYCVEGANRTVKEQTLEIAALTKQLENTKDVHLKLETEKKEMAAKIVKLKGDKQQLENDLHAVQKSKLYKRRQLEKKAMEKIKEENRALQKQFQQCNSNSENLKRQKRNLQKKHSSLQRKMEKMNKELERIALGMGLPLNNKNITTRLENSREFTLEVRRTFTELQGKADVAATKCRKVVQIVAQHLFGQTLADRDLPCVQSILNMADEGHVLSKIQIAETILNADHVTLHTDGTSRDHNKIVGQQISNEGYTMSLGFVQVDTENAATLLDVTVNILQELTDIYCENQNAGDKEEIFKSMLGKITSTMSDRAAVMKCFNSKLKQFRCSELQDEDADLHFLYCNAHFLLGLSRACDTGLKKIEKDLAGESVGLGRDAQQKFNHFKSSETVTSRIIRLAADLFGPRGDEKSGCRTEWLAHCSNLEKSSLITSFRENRFNCYFESAAGIIFHLQDILSFLSSGFPSHNNLKMQSVQADLEDDRVFAPLCSVAIVYMRITGPYWNLLQSDVPYIHFHQYVQQMSTKLSCWKEDAAELLNTDFQGIFNGRFEINNKKLLDTVLSFAQTIQSSVIDCLQQLMAEFLVVTCRQLADFQAGGKFGQDLPDDAKTALSHCHLTNLIGENCFGDLDFDIGKRRHASLHHRSSLHMWKRNKTGNWLEKKSPQDLSSSFETARKNRHILRLKHKQQEQVVQMKIREKILENERLKKMKEQKAVDQKRAIIQTVHARGGPCQTARDIDKLLKKARSQGETIEMLKSEIRYQKTILGVGQHLRLAGKVTDLANSLKEHLRQPGDQDTEQSEERNSRVGSETSSDSELSDDNDEIDMNVKGLDDNDRRTPFQFRRQGQWVSVYYDNMFYVGQVVEIKSDSCAVIKFLQKTKGRFDYFKWPTIDELAEVDSMFVYAWDFAVDMVSSNGRMWSIPGVKKLDETYQQLKQTSV